MTSHVAPRKTFELFAILCLLPALYIQLKWMQIFNSSGSTSAAARTRSFLDEFPTFLASSRLLALISLASAVGAIMLAQRSFNQTNIFWRVSSFIVVFVASLIALLSLFQMF